MATTRTATGARKLIEVTKRDALAARHKKLTSLSALIRRRLATVVESFYDIGVALTEIAKAKLYAADGHASLEAYLDAEKLLSVSQARKLIDIVKNIPREQAVAVGQERAYALIALSRATPEPDSAVDLIAEGEVDGQPAAKASVRAITAAAKAQREKAPKTPVAKARRKTEVALERGLRALLRAAGLSVTAVRINKDVVRVELPRANVEKALAKA